MRFGSRLGLCREVSGLLLFCERRDDLAVPMGCFFRAIVAGGAGSVVVGEEIGGRWEFGRCFVFSGVGAADVPQWK